jgi:tetratricopeptide (TPR) repeat protein
LTPAPAILLLAASAYGPVVVVAPEGPPSAETAWIGAAVADALPRDLGLLKVPAVDRADLRQTLEKLGITGTPVTRASAIRVAEALQASRLVTGSYVSEDAQVTLSLRLLDVERATLSAPLIATGPLARLPELIAGLAWDIALAGSTRPASSREEFLAQEPPVPLEALRAYARALSVSDPVARAKLLRRVLGVRPAYDEARLALGRLQVETREFEGALESLKRIPAASRVGRTARFLEGVAFLGLGRYAEASELYAALVAEGPSPAALNNQALALLRLGRGTTRASAVLRRAIDLDRNALDVPFNLGFALLTEGQAEAAAFWLETVVGRDPADARAQVVLAWASRMAGREAQADALWRQVVAQSPSYETLATPDLARRFERIRDSEAPPLRGSDDSAEGGPAATLVAHAEALLREDRLDDALTELRRAVYLEPTDPRIHLLIARLYRARGETEQALASFRRSLWSRDDTAVRLEMDSLASSPNR